MDGFKITPKRMHVSTKSERRRIAKMDREYQRDQDRIKAREMKDKGYSMSYIAERLIMSESAVRALLEDKQEG